MQRWLACLVLFTTNARADESSIPSVMNKRWALHMGYGAAVMRARTDDAELTPLAGVQFGLRFRMIPDLQLGLVVEGGFDGSGGYAGFGADLRYSLLAERPWNPYVVGAVGLGGVDQSGRQVFLRGGVGIERRYTSWAFSLEAHLSRVGGNDDIVVRAPDDEPAHFGVWSGAVDLVAHYHWGGSRHRRRFVP